MENIHILSDVYFANSEDATVFIELDDGKKGTNVTLEFFLNENKIKKFFITIYPSKKF